METIKQKLKWIPGSVGIEAYNTTKASGISYIKYITCRKCDCPLRIDMYRRSAIEDSWMVIEPMYWVNSCWWFCTGCQKERVKSSEETGGVGFAASSIKNQGLFSHSKHRGQSLN